MNTPTPEAEPAVPEDVIVAEGLTKVYGDHVAVDGIDLRVRAGEIFGLLGPNGAGKTTTILMLLGLTERTRGTARVLGADPARETLRIRRGVGYLPDDVGFYDDLTGRQNLAYTARLNRLDRRAIDDRIDAVAEQVELSDAIDRRVGTYSRGMRQRLGIADALVKGPTLLFLDEPTVNIDPEGVRQTLALVRRLRDESGMSIVLSSHLLHQVQQVCDRIAIFVGGHIAAIGTVEELGEQSDTLIEVEVAGDPRAAASVLAAIEGVQEVSIEAALMVVQARFDVRAAIFDALVAEGFRLRHLALRAVDLDAIYHRYFTAGVGA